MPTDEDFDVYVAARWARMVPAAVLLGCSREDAEDAVQSALVRCLPVWSRIQRASTPDAYVYRVLTNVIATSRRRWRPQGEPTAGLAPWPHVPSPAASSDNKTVVAEALTRLHPDHRAVLVLRFYADLREREVAEVLGVPVGTVKSRASRALKALADDLDMRIVAGKEDENG